MKAILLFGLLGFIAGVGLVVAAPGDPPSVSTKEDKEAVILRLEATRAEVPQGEAPKMIVTLVNKRKETVTLVQPGDGSNCGWRTPIMGWSVIKVTDGGVAKHPTELPLHKGGRCGNINSLKKTEVFTLAPGKSKEVEGWVGAPSLLDPGTYSVVVYYSNDPDLTWKGLPLGKHDPEAMEQVKKSFQCALISNPVQIVVKAAK